MKNNLRQRLLAWCPQPKITFPASTQTRISTSVFAFALIAEVVMLLVAPIAYYALLAPKPDINLMQEFPLTNEEINAAWPNLPTADEKVNNATSGPYLAIDPSCATYNDVKNCTQLNIPNFKDGGLIPVAYHIWLQHNDTWVKVPSSYLGTDNAPAVPPEEKGFLGTSMPTEFGTIAVIIIAVTALASAGYVVSIRKNYAQTRIRPRSKGAKIE